MANDYDGEPLTLDDLWHIGYAVGTMLRPREFLYDGLSELDAYEVESLRSGYDAGVRDTESELKQRAEREQAAPLPVCDDEIPF